MRKQAFLERAQRLEKGQSLVEMTVGFVILVIIMGGLLDLGRVYFIFLALEDGAGEGAIYLAIDPDCRTAADGSQCANPNNGEWRARNAGGGLIDWSGAAISIDRPIVSVGETVRVTVSYQFPLLTPIIPRIAGLNPLTLSVTATQTIIAE